MGDRSIVCADSSRWKVMVVGRPSPHRLDLVFESLDHPGRLLRGEVGADELGDLTDQELCFLVREQSP